MPDLLLYTIFIILFFFLELLYFRIALANNIIDKPNERSSHKRFTIRGGGIIFPVSVLSWFILNQFQYPFFVAGLLLISCVSFLDDIKNLYGRTRIFFQFLALGLLFLQFQFLIKIDWYWYILIFILLTGAINAYNFMDGINGITGSYSLITVGTLYYINQFIISFTSEMLLVLIILSLVVFNFFNFRLKARCFAGDVGSISISFMICFLMFQLINATGYPIFIGFLLVYGLDAVTTIVFRLIRRENIFQAHRSHFYQFLANEKKWPHLLVSMVYSLAQLIINLLIILLFYQKEASFNDILFLSGIILISGILFVLIRLKLEGYEFLFHARRIN